MSRRHAVCWQHACLEPSDRARHAREVLPLAAVLLALTSTTLPPPGDGLELIPGPRPEGPAIGRVAPIPPSPGPSLPPVGVFGGAMAALAAATREVVSTRRRRSMGAVGSVPEDALVVFVPGYGSERGEHFADMIAALRLGAGQTIEFDYRYVEAVDAHTSASRRASNAEIVDGLHSFLAGLATSGRPIYLVGFSKGGAGIAGLLKKWDLHPELALGNVRGAALLDAPIARGAHGILQSAPVPFLPSDGGYQPMHCRVLGHLRCTDSRVGLGRAAGVEVVAFRNSYSHLTSFGDRPQGMRIYELKVRPEPGGFASRVASAHREVLVSSAVAACLIDEIAAAGSCRWESHRWLPARVDDWVHERP